jgi:hypothetical protein
MPAKGRVTKRPMTPAEIAALPPGAVEVVGATTFDVWLNDRAYWRNIPTRVERIAKKRQSRRNGIYISFGVNADRMFSVDLD